MDHGRATEEILERICFSLFSRDLVLRSPKLQEPSGEKELTDILVLVDETAIVIQSKSIKIEASELNETSFGRIDKKRRRAKQQLSTTLNALSRGSTVKAKTPSGVEFEIDWQSIKERIGIVTLNLPDAAYEDPEFRFQYPVAVEDHKGMETHIFLLRDLYEMASELSTPADVLLYLRARKRCISSGKFIIGNELDFLGFFKIQYPEIEKALSDPAYNVVVIPGFWEDYKNEHIETIEDREERFRSSRLIDRIIDALSTGVDHTTQMHGVAPQQSAVNYLRLIGKLNKLTRMERAQVANKIIEKMKKTEHSKWGYFIYVSMLMDTAYLFLLLNEEKRQHRIAFLEYLCEQACHSLSCREIVGVASNGAKVKDFSIDAIVMDVSTVKAESTPDPKFKMFQHPVSGTLNEWDS
jgi:hypothetical protein